MFFVVPVQLCVSGRLLVGSVGEEVAVTLEIMFESGEYGSDVGEEDVV